MSRQFRTQTYFPSQITMNKDLIEMQGASDAMKGAVKNLVNPPVEGDMVEGLVIALGKAAVYVNLPPFGTGIIFGREYIMSRDVIRKIRVGDTIKAKVVDIRNEEGYIELSLKEARQALIWGEVEDAIKTKKIVGVTVTDANKGGLIMSWQGLQGFLPASQLSADHYPRVTDGDKNRILEELKKLIGKELAVSVIGATPEDGKLIFSEKNSGGESTSSSSSHETKSVSKYKVGDVLDGDVTGVVDFGVFVKVAQNLEGLVHISEIDWSLVENPRQHYSVGDKVKVKVIEVKDDKISLSIKALMENPWTEAGKKYKKGDAVKGVVIKHNKHGALVSIEEGVAGLVHISEFGTPVELKEKMELGKSYQFKITLFDAKDQKMTLTTKI
jgi:small subunit ribosomal protein S1